VLAHPPEPLAATGAQHAVLILDAGVLPAGLAQPRVPALDIPDGEARQWQARDRILLDGVHATLLVARRRRCPRVEVLLDPRVEHITDGATTGRSATRADLQFGSDALRVSLASVHRARQLRRPSA
jgi:hypothetical protein